MENKIGSVNIYDSYSAFKTWSKIPLEDRKKVISAIIDYILGNMHKINNDFAINDPYEILYNELMPSISLLNFWLDNVDGQIATKKISHVNRVFANKDGNIHFRPIGTIGIIVGRSSAIYWPLCQIIPAIMTGNVVVFKHSHVWHDKFKSMWNDVWNYVCEAFSEDIKNVVQIVGDDKDYDSTRSMQYAINMIDELAIDKIFYSGSTQNAKAIRQRAATGNRNLVVYSSNKDISIVDETADLEKAAEFINWSVYNQSGIPINSTETILVHKDVYDNFIAFFRSHMSKNWNLTDSQHKKKMEELIADGDKHGAKIEYIKHEDARAVASWQFDPSFATDIDGSMKSCFNSVGGPYAMIIPYDNQLEMIDFINHSYNTGSINIWTNRDDCDNYYDIESIKVSNISFNCISYSYFTPDIPWGGSLHVGNSPINGVNYIMNFVWPQFVSHNKTNKSDVFFSLIVDSKKKEQKGP
jgi:acyl-CoA reductase-like NAD-dependent aldehyde dehydrogenase